MRQLHIIQACEDIPRFCDETLIQLYNASKFGLSDKFRVIVFLPAWRMGGFSKRWKEIEQLFPETKFFYYSDAKAQVTDLMVNYDYHNVHRLCSLERHFREFPELTNDAIFYIDSDVIFTKQPSLEDYTQDDVNYLSDTKTYLNEEYLSGKIKDVMTNRKEEFIEADVVKKAASFAGLTQEDLKSHNNNTGGAQYLLKDMTPKFFSECIDICLQVRMFFQSLNQYFFPGDTPLERENKGFQSFCADMFAIQWNLWRNKRLSETPKWMDFAWATDGVERLNDVFLLHNAGITSEDSIRITDGKASIKDENGQPIILNIPCFWKGKYKLKSVFNDIPEIQKIVDNEHSQKYCTSVYAKEIIETYNNLIKTKDNGS